MPAEESRRVARRRQSRDDTEYLVGSVLMVPFGLCMYAGWYVAAAAFLLLALLYGLAVWLVFPD